MSLFSFEPSGKMKIPTQEECSVADDYKGIIALSRGVQADGRPYYAYIAVLPSMYVEFARMTMERITCNLDEFGAVLCADSLADPPEFVAQFMRDCYGFDEDFQQKLFDEMKKEQKEFVGKKEEKRVNDIVEMMKKQKPVGTA